jgi:hypothetical protein
MSEAIGPGDLVICVNVAPNHATGRPVPLVAGETYRVRDIMDFACPCGRGDALLDIGVDFAWCQTRFACCPSRRPRRRRCRRRGRWRRFEGGGAKSHPRKAGEGDREEVEGACAAIALSQRQSALGGNLVSQTDPGSNSDFRGCTWLRRACVAFGRIVCSRLPAQSTRARQLALAAWPRILIIALILNSI